MNMFISKIIIYLEPWQIIVTTLWPLVLWLKDLKEYFGLVLLLERIKLFDLF